MEFVKVTLEDLELIKRLSKIATAIVKEHYDPIIGVEQNAYMLEKYQSEKAIVSQLKEGYNYYLINDGTDVGFLGFYPKENYMYLSKFYLSKDTRGKGYGKKMIEYVREEALKQGLHSIQLNVNKYNSTIEIYEKLGFKIIRSEKNDIGNGFFMDDYVMEYCF